MKLKLLGSKVRVEIIILCVLMGVIIGASLLCSCSCSRENFHNAAPIGGDLHQYDFSQHGVKHNKGAVQNQPTNPMMPGQKYFWANNKFTPECCETSTISSSKGCACITSEQKKFLAQRGNNCANGPCSF